MDELPRHTTPAASVCARPHTSEVCVAGATKAALKETMESMCADLQKVRSTGGESQREMECARRRWRRFAGGGRRLRWGAPEARRRRGKAAAVDVKKDVCLINRDLYLLTYLFQELSGAASQLRLEAEAVPPLLQIGPPLALRAAADPQRARKPRRPRRAGGVRVLRAGRPFWQMPALL